MYSFLWVIPRLLDFMDRSFGTSMKMEQKGCSEKSAHEIQTSGNHQKERMEHLQQGENLKFRKQHCSC